MKNFHIKKNLREGFELTKKHFSLLARVILIIIITSAILNQLTDLSHRHQKDLAFILFNTAAIIIGIIFQVGLIQILLKLNKGAKAKLKDLFSGTDYTLKFFFATILYTLATGVGLVLLIIPGIIIATRLRFYDLYMIDENLGVMDSLKKSWRITKGQTFRLVLFFLAQIGVNLLGLLAFIVGLLWTIPATEIARVRVYKELK